MGTDFIPTPQDIERYKRLRGAARTLNNTILKTIPREAYVEIGKILGIWHHGAMVLDTEDETSVLMDCILYDWYRDGKNIAEQYAESHPQPPGSDEEFLLRAYKEAGYVVLRVDSAIPGAGVHCTDLFQNEELFVMDISMSQLGRTGYSIATRIIPMGDYWVTGGALLPIDRDVRFEDAIAELGDRITGTSDGPRGFSLGIVRACLAAGAAERVRYTKPARPRQGHLPPKLPRRR